MLKLLSSAADQPCSDSPQIQKALDSIAGLPPQEAIREITETLEALSPVVDVDPPAALQLLAALDEASHLHTRHLVTNYLEEFPQQGRNVMFLQAHHFWAQLADCFADLLAAFEAADTPPTSEQRGELCARLIRASTEGQRWDALHYGPFERRHWNRIGQAWLAAAGVERLPVRLRAARPTETSVEREYLRAIAFAVSAPEALDEVQIEQMWRLIHLLLPSLELRRTSTPDTIYSIDPVDGCAPVRGAALGDDSHSRRYFSAPRAIGTFHELMRALSAGTLPEALDVSAPEAALRFEPMLHHLIEYWSPEPPVRSYWRHPMPARIRVVEGMTDLLEWFAGNEPSAFNRWEQIDVNLQGLGAQAWLSETHPLRVGMMVGLEGANDQRIVAVVRRVMRIAEERAFIGASFMSWHPELAAADDGTQQSKVLLLDLPHKTATVRLAIPSGQLGGAAPLSISTQEMTVRLNPVAVLEHTSDHEVRSYHVVSVEKTGVTA